MTQKYKLRGGVVEAYRKKDAGLDFYVIKNGRNDGHEEVVPAYAFHRLFEPVPKQCEHEWVGHRDSGIGTDLPGEYIEYCKHCGHERNED